MPLPLTVSCFSKIQISFTFLVLAHLGSPEQTAVKWVCARARACACVRVCVRACVRAASECACSEYNTNSHFEATLLQVVINSSWTDFLVLLANLRYIAGAVHHKDIVSHLGAKRVEVVQSPLKLHVKVHAVVWRHQSYTKQLMLIFIQKLPSHFSPDLITIFWGKALERNDTFYKSNTLPVAKTTMSQH